ncbi:MAG: hypothetical protein ABR586_03100 [Thermoplasmatota archaeon]
MPSRDGVLVLPLLRRKGHNCMERPHVILLDLAMPKMSGQEVLSP